MPKPDLAQLDSLTLGDSSNTTTSTEMTTIADDIDALTLADELESTVLKLSDYLAAVELVVKETFKHTVWVKAEIRNLSSKNGHYYFELAEKDERGKVVASCRGNLWKFKAKRVLAKFERATGIALERDVTVLLNVNATFHPLYGFSLSINDIDPSYTLGDMARQYAAIVERLASEGLLNLNKQLSAPFDIEHVLVIAPEKAAGLGDFRADADRLAATGACHFHYHYATFQSNTAPSDIRHALTKGMLTFKQQHAKKGAKTLPDLIVIIRGGGAVGDLAYLNDYELAALVAEQPVPVWVGIGHERDKVMLDEVAHTSFDTPSKVIAAIMTHLTLLMQRAQSYADSIGRSSQQRLTAMRQDSERQFASIQHSSRHSLQRWQHLSDSQFNSVKQYAKFELRAVSQVCTSNFARIQQSSKANLKQTTAAIDNYCHASKINSQNVVNEATKQVRYYQQVILVQHPARLLGQGYSLVQDESDTYLNSVASIAKGDFVQVTMSDGQFMAVVTAVHPTK